jgi:hypothetical protein
MLSIANKGVLLLCRDGSKKTGDCFSSTIKALSAL